MANQIALVGGESLLGSELRTALGRDVPGAKVKLVGSDTGGALITEVDGEAVVMTSLDESTIADSQVVVLAGSSEASFKALELVKKAKQIPVLIDLSYALETQPGMRLRAPMAELTVAPAQKMMSVANPASIVLATFLRALHAAAPVKQVVAQVFQPVSELGRAGVDELHQQTIQLLQFKKLPQKVFDAQITFNILAKYGLEAPVKLQTEEVRIEKHLASLLAGEIPMPSLRVLQAPVMHGHSFSLWVELDEASTLPKLKKALSKDPFDWWGEDLDGPSVVNVAGQNGITIGAVEKDRNNPNAYWFWIVTDNFIISSSNTVALANSIFQKGKR